MPPTSNSSETKPEQNKSINRSSHSSSPPKQKRSCVVLLFAPTASTKRQTQRCNAKMPTSAVRYCCTSERFLVPAPGRRSPIRQTYKNSHIETRLGHCVRAISLPHLHVENAQKTHSQPHAQRRTLLPLPLYGGVVERQSLHRPQQRVEISVVLF